jgi:hypothetical protein
MVVAVDKVLLKESLPRNMSIAFMWYIDYMTPHHSHRCLRQLVSDAGRRNWLSYVHEGLRGVGRAMVHLMTLFEKGCTGKWARS